MPSIYLYFSRYGIEYNYPPHLLPLITKLDVERQSVSVSNMVNLKHLCVFNTSHIKHFDLVLEKLTNLTTIEFCNQRIAEISYLIKKLPKLRRIRFNVIQDGPHFEDDILNLSALNNERKKCANACNLTMYVRESIYLATKGAARTTSL